MRALRRLELALLDPVAGPAPVGDLGPWRDGLAARARALRRVESAVAGDLARESAAWRAGQERRLRSWLLLAGRGPAADPAAHTAADRLGLVVVGRLARRNGFEVRLGRSPAGGVSAAVRVPAALLAPSPAVPVRRR